MQRIQPVDTAQAPHKEVFSRVEARLGRIPGMLRLMGNSPEVLQGYLAMNEAFQRGNIGARLRLLLTATVAQITGCDYTLSFASALAKKDGVTPQEFDATRRAESADPKLRAALRFAAHAVGMQGRVPESEVTGLKAAGYGDQEVAEIAVFVGLSLLRSYFNLIVATENDFPAVRSAELLTGVA